MPLSRRNIIAILALALAVLSPATPLERARGCTKTCGRAPTPPGSAASLPRAPMHPRAASASPGCGTTHNPGYNTNDTNGFVLVSGGLTRRYTVRVPTAYDPHTPYPLILDYHGHGGSRDGQHANSAYDASTHGRRDFLVVYPQGLRDGADEPAWEGAPYARADVDDLAFTADLLGHIKGHYCVDAARVYASGKSNGGGFVGTLACSAQGGAFAAFAMAAAALYTDNLNTSSGTYRTCTPARARVPVLEAHGTADGTIPYTGGVRSQGTRVTPDIQTWLRTWAGRNGCAGAGVEESHAGWGTTSWSCGGDEDVVKGVHIDGYGHCWPTTGTNTDNGPGKTCAAGSSPVQFTDMVLDFFDSWELPEVGVF